MKRRTLNPQKNIGVSKKALEALELPEDIFLGMPLLSLSGNRSLCITNHRGIRQYESGQIVIAAKSFLIQIAGRNLYIPSMTVDEVKITGHIESVLFIP